MVNLALFVKAFGGFFAIMNPFINLPIFLALTSTYDAARQRSAGMRVALYSVLMAAVIMATGTALLKLFGISVDHFRVAGGIVLMTIALGMLSGSTTSHSGTDQERATVKSRPAEADVSFYPMTFPIILGPGTITAIVVFTSGAHGIPGYLAVAAALAVTLVLLVGVLWFAPSIGHWMSQTLRTIMTRLMGMVLAAIAIEMVVDGLLNLIPALRG